MRGCWFCEHKQMHVSIFNRFQDRNDQGQWIFHLLKLDFSGSITKKASQQALNR